MKKPISSLVPGLALALGLAACDFHDDPPLAPGSSAAPLEKAAAAVFRDIRVKDVNYFVPFVLYRSATVLPNETMSAWTTRPAASATDPILVGFYQASGVAGDRAYRTQIVAYDDDGAGNHNSLFTWKNTTGAARVVEVMAFAYNAVSNGPCTLWTKASQGGARVRTYGAISATRIKGNTPVNTECTGPTHSRLGMKTLLGGGHPAGVIAVNLATMHGGIIHIDDAVLTLAEVLPASQFILPYMMQRNDPGLEASRYNAWQWDRYSCPFTPL